MLALLWVPMGAGLHLAQHSGVYTFVVSMYALLYVIVHIVMAIDRNPKNTFKHKESKNSISVVLYIIILCRFCI